MDYLKAIIIDYASKGIIVDTNLLILFIVGFYDIAYIEKFKRVKNKGYTKEDFDALRKLLSYFKCLYVTPQILSEVSNLSFGNVLGNAFNEYFAEVVKIISEAKEKHISKDIILKMPVLYKFGFTDSSIFKLAKNEDLPVITDDSKLNGMLNKEGIRSINMDTIRACS